jgi:hypothetical protein
MARLFTVWIRKPNSRKMLQGFSKNKIYFIPKAFFTLGK